MIIRNTREVKLELYTILVCMAMKSPWSSKGEYTGDGDCKLVLTCQPANAGECELRIPPVVDDAIPKPQSSDKATLSLNWEPVVIHFSREVKTPIKNTL